MSEMLENILEHDPPQQINFSDFLHNALFGYKEERHGDALYISGRVGRQNSIQIVFQWIVDEFEKKENARIVESGNKMLVVFTEPVDGISRIEFEVSEGE
jgi:hypothetical protein